MPTGARGGSGLSLGNFRFFPVNPGYIYILQNPSLSETHLKIGRTERDPDERASEISRATGVPTPFEVAWWSESFDCHLAEVILHEYLDSYRTNTTREFFDVDLYEAIRAAKRAIHDSGGRTGGMGYVMRRVFRWTFHGIIRPLLRLPLQFLLLLVVILGWVIRGSLLLVGSLLFGSNGDSKNGKNPREKSYAPQRNPLFVKEIFGASIWIFLTWFFLCADGANRCREMIQDSPFREMPKVREWLSSR